MNGFSDNRLDELCMIRNFDHYIDSLARWKDMLLIVISAAGNVLTEKFDKIATLDFKNVNISGRCVTVIKAGSIAFQKVISSKEEAVVYEDAEAPLTLSLSGNELKVLMAGIDHSLLYADKPIKIVTFETETNKIVDSVFFDPSSDNGIICHKNPKYTEDYFNSHFYLYEKYKRQICSFFEFSYRSDKELNAIKVKNAIVEPIKRIGGKSMGGVCDDSFRILAGHPNFSNNGETNSRYVTSSYKVSSDELEYCDEDVIWGGIMYDHPGHLIIESIAGRLWYWVNNPDQQSKKIAVVVCWGDGTGRFLLEFAEALNIPAGQLMMVSKPTKFASVTVPDASEYVYSWPGICEYTPQYASVFEHIRASAASRGIKKVYLTKSKQNNIVGEDFFIDFFKAIPRKST